MHQALYRKWRPRTFDDVCGQEHVTSVLRYEVAHGAASHAYLFCGSRGTGKTTCAKILAKAVNCEDPQNGNPCGVCAACRAIDSGAATDVLEMDAASNNGVDNIRDIRDEVVYTPSLLKYRVYIVDEVHMLSASAFNALLKTLEEPPAHVVFILATTELQKLPATIVSRCQRFDFRRIALPVLAARVTYIAEQENISLSPEAAARIARMAQGGMRDAISLLELCAGAGKAVDVATVEEMTGTTGRGEMLALAGAVADADYNAIFAAVDRAVASARDIAVFWQDLMGVYRDLLVMSTTDAAARYLDLTDAETAELAALAKKLPRARLLAHCKLLEEAFLAMGRAGAVKRMIAEMTLVRLADPTLDASAEGLLARVEKLEAALANGARRTEAPPARPQPSEPAPQQPAPTAPANAPFSAPAAPKSAETGQKLRRLRGFANCLERVRREKPMLGSFLQGTEAFEKENGAIVVRLANPLAETLIARENAVALLRDCLAAELGRPVGETELSLEVADPRKQPDSTPFDDLIDTINEERKGEQP